jgi:hypothetical protein
VPEVAQHRAVARQLRDILAARLSGSELAGEVDRVVAILVHYLREEQAILASTEELQAAINAMLGRPRPTRPLTTRDLRVTFAMYGGSIAEFMYLFDMLEQELGFRVACTSTAIEVTDLRGVPVERESGQGYASSSAGAR